MAIRNPIEWGWDSVKVAAHGVGTASRSFAETDADLARPMPAVRKIAVADLGVALRKGFDDFAAYRTDVMFLCVIYPVVGLVLARIISNAYGLVPLLFPLASGFALLGPVAAIGLYEMSRRRERGEEVDWATAFGVLRSPSFGAIIDLTIILLAIFALWLGAAQAIYHYTLGPKPPISVEAFVNSVLTTEAGHRMIEIGMGVGFLFALMTLMISVVSFPLLLDRETSVGNAIWTSLRAVAANPGPMALWGLIIAAALVIGSLPLFIGLIVVLPVLGHATWHLYRRMVA
jgi:uncharacterized membrane protein